VSPHVRIAIVVAGGSPLPTGIAAAVPAGAFIVAADSGLDHAIAAGLRPDLVVGDLDSVSADALAWARREGVPIQEHPPDKDATDTELAIAVALARGIDELILVGGGGTGDRLDHSIGALAALGHRSLAHVDAVSARWGEAHVVVLHGPRERMFAVTAGSTFSLIALHGACAGVSLGNARWPLHNATIEPGSSLGVSNLTLTDSLTVAVHSGVLTVIFPTSDIPPGAPS